MNWLLGALVLVALLATLPLGQAAPVSSAPHWPPALHATAKSCFNQISCQFAITTARGNGSASTGYSYVTFVLPGESNKTITGYTNLGIATGNVSLGHFRGTFVATDVNSGKVVLGSSVTNFTVVTHCSSTGCYSTYKLINGSMTFQRTIADGTSLTVSCNPSSIGAGNATLCKVTVTDGANATRHPYGNVTFASSIPSYGPLRHGGKCSLRTSGSCSVRSSAADETAGMIRMDASYAGTTTFYASSGYTYLYVTGN